MYLEKLVITGFKSFYNKTTFEFKKPYISIVGPNGGGKTNVVDALRWVMGEQSAKLIRAKKAEDAIFSGSKKLGRLGMAQVDLYLKNEDNRLKIDYPEVVLSRKLYRNGDSEYTINKNKVRLADIIMLLAKSNFGQKSYGIIGQGMITDILNANPQDRKEFFDDACGVREFQIKRDQALNKLIRSEENLESADTLLGEIEPRLRSLRRQVRKLERRKEIEAELQEIQIKYYGTYYIRYNDQIKVDRQRKEEQTAELEKITATIKNLEKETERLGQEKSRTENFAQLQQEQNKFLNEKNKFIQEQVVLKGKLEIEQEKQGQTNLAWLSKKADELRGVVAGREKELENIESNIIALEEKLKQTTVDQEKFGKEFRDFEYALLKAKEDLEKHISVLSVPEIRDDLKGIFVEQESFLKRLLSCSTLDTFKAVQKDAEIVTTHIAALLDQLYEQKDDEIAAKKMEISQLQKKLQTALEAKETTLNKSNDLRIEIQTKKEKINLIVEAGKGEKLEFEKIENEVKEIETALGKDLDKESKLLQYQRKNDEIKNQIDALDKKLVLVENKISQFNVVEENKKNELLRLQSEIRSWQQKSNASQSLINEIDINLAKLETKREDILLEMEKEMNEQAQKQAKELKEQAENTEEIMIEVEKLKHELELIGGIDPETLAEHEDTEKRYEFLKTQTTDLKKTIMSLDKLIDSLDVKIKNQFNKAFKKISENFSKYFELVFEGGSAKLSLVMDEENEEEGPDSPEATQESTKQKVSDFAPLGKKKKRAKIVSGIEIEASPPGKKLKNVHALSGGEKSMTAISLICSIIDSNTPPFVVLDEVEAALDESNAEKFANIIRHLSKKTQFVVITHNRETMQKADVLYGVTMQADGSSSILSVKLDEAKKFTQE
ncbi:MAG: AAA family ATPase [Patescibacteria group bacterium]